MNLDKPKTENTFNQPIPVLGGLQAVLDSFGPWRAIKGKTTLLLPLITLGAFALGILLGAVSEGLSDLVNTTANAFIEFYSIFAPVLIFLVLSPVLSRILSTRQRGKFGLYVVGWLAVSKIVAMLFAVLFTALIFGMPVISSGSVSIWDALSQTGKTLLNTLTVSQYFWAIYAAIAIGVIAIKVGRLAQLLEKGVTGIEYVGQYIQPFIPLFMVAIGVYVQSLPENLEEQLGLSDAVTEFHRLSILGLHPDPNTSSGMVAAYLLGALLVGIAAFIWHFGLLALTKWRVKQFSIKGYFKNYWIKAYLLLWATSSETIATPLNLYILRKHAPWVRPTVRRLVAGMGSVLCTNGTLISVYILVGLVGGILGLEFSLLELMLSIPVVFLISFGIPGIPGELLLFAGPLAMILPVPDEMGPLFLALYLGLQIGLPDSFRTGCNTTNNYVYCILLNETYKSRFMAKESKGEMAEPEDWKND